MKAERPGLAFWTEFAGAGCGARLDWSGKGGCGGWEGAAGVKAEDSEGIEATLVEAGEEAVNPPPLPPNGRAVLLDMGLA